MESVEEFKLAQALFECSIYCEIISCEGETNAVRSAACQIVQNWIEQQDLSRKEKFDLFDRLSKPGPLAHFVETVIKKKHFEQVVAWPEEVDARTE